jgi:hypothetical protein
MKDIDNWFVKDERPPRGSAQDKRRRQQVKKMKKLARAAIRERRRSHSKTDERTPAPRAKKRKRVFAAAALVMTAAMAAVLFAAGIFTADENSLATGWGTKRTELAFAVNGDKLSVTVMGRRLEADASPAADAAACAVSGARRAKKGLDLLKPAPARLADMAAEAITPPARRLAQDFWRVLAEL